MAKHVIIPALTEAGLEWPGWYALRRGHGTELRKAGDIKTASKALGNSEAVAERHYIKTADEVPADVRRAVNAAFA